MYDGTYPGDWLREIEKAAGLRHSQPTPGKSVEGSKKQIKQKVRNVLNLNSFEFKVDTEKRRVEIYDNDKKIGEMYFGEYHISDEVYEHVGIEIDEEYRGVGLGKKLFNTFDEAFGVLNIEYARDKKIAKFLFSVGYNAIAIINEETGEEEELELYGENEEALTFLKKGYTLKLEYDN